MKPGAPPDPAAPPIARSRQAFPWAMALGRGFLAFLTVALMAQLIAFAMGLVRGGLATATVAKLGWFYALAFHRVPIEIVGSSFGYRVSVAFLTGTALALWVGYRHGREIGRRVDGRGRWEPPVAVAVFALAYAVPFGLLTRVVRLEIGAGSQLLGLDGVRLQGLAVQAFVLPLLLAAGAGAVGMLMVVLPSSSRAQTALVEGWRMFCLALGFSLVGLLVLASVRPAGLATYVRALIGHGLGTDALLVGHQALLLPNQALFVLVPSMGGCVGLHGATSWDPIACLGHLPRLEDAYLLLSAETSGPGAQPSSLSRAMPTAYLLFLFVPLAATAWVGRTIRSSTRDVNRWTTALIATGVVFAICTGVGSWFAGITVEDASAPQPASATLGVRILPTALIALAWGVGGGAIGALLPRRQDAVPLVPPRPTSE